MIIEPRDERFPKRAHARREQGQRVAGRECAAGVLPRRLAEIARELGSLPPDVAAR